MRLLDYQRTVIGYHGTDETVVTEVLAGNKHLEYSQNRHDWLGKGIYFWEHGPRRAYEWAIWRASHGGPGASIKKPAVVAALINLGRCFDLLDTANTELLGRLFPLYLEDCRAVGREIPRNEPAHKNDLDLTKRNLDCAVMNWVVELREREEGTAAQTVRGLFSEGIPAFPGSSIMAKSHIQIAVRDPDVILGYFRPMFDFLPK